MAFQGLSGYQLDVLREIGTIGAGHAATSLSTFTDSQVGITVPTVNIVTLDDIAEQTGGDEELVATAFVRLEGEISATMFLVIPADSVQRMIEHFHLAKTPSNGHFPEMEAIELSLIAEVGNILCSSYAMALDSFLGLSGKVTVPGVAVDMAKAILSAGLLEAGIDGDEALVVHTRLQLATMDATAHFYLIPKPSAVEKMLSLLGVNLHD